jgi:hypothetical protein
MQRTVKVIELVLLIASQLAPARDADVMAVGDIAQLGFELFIGPHADICKVADFVVLALIAGNSVDFGIADNFFDGLADEIAIGIAVGPGGGSARVKKSGRAQGDG